MLKGLAFTLISLIIGETLTSIFVLPVPGSAIGLILLATFFACRGGPDEGSMALFDITAPYFPVFFVPAAVGVIVSLEVLAQAWVQFVAAIFLSSAATLVTTGWVMQSVLRLTRREREI